MQHGFQDKKNYKNPFNIEYFKMKTGRICKNKRTTANQKQENVEYNPIINRKLGRVLSQPSLPANIVKNISFNEHTNAFASTQCEDVPIQPQNEGFKIKKYQTFQGQTKCLQTTKHNTYDPNVQDRMCYQKEQIQNPQFELAEVMDTVFSMDKKNKEHVRKMDEVYINKIRQLECQCSAKDLIIEELKGLLKDKEQEIQRMEKMYVIDSRASTSRIK